MSLHRHSRQRKSPKPSFWKRIHKATGLWPQRGKGRQGRVSMVAVQREIFEPALLRLFSETPSQAGEITEIIKELTDAIRQRNGNLGESGAYELLVAIATAIDDDLRQELEDIILRLQHRAHQQGA